MNICILESALMATKLYGNKQFWEYRLQTPSRIMGQRQLAAITKRIDANYVQDNYKRNMGLN